jgi:uncharacterized protein (TIGR02145 family)
MKNILFVTTLLLLSSSLVSAQDTVHVYAGWNIIGSVKAGAVPDVLSTIPVSIITTVFFGYAPGSGYQSTDTLGKGLGYWVKVSADGIVIFNTSTSDRCGIKRVEYGGFSYGTVQIGSQCWLNENLNVGMMIIGVPNQTNNGTLEKYCYDDDLASCGMYGGLYQWDEAMQYVSTEGAQGICPAGWHIPTYAEFQTLSNSVSGDGNELKKGGVGASPGLGTNASGFSALLAGLRYAGAHAYGYLGSSAYMWSSSEYDASFAGVVNLSYSNGSVAIWDASDKPGGFSVRCLGD